MQFWFTNRCTKPVPSTSVPLVLYPVPRPEDSGPLILQTTSVKKWRGNMDMWWLGDENLLHLLDFRPQPAASELQLSVNIENPMYRMEPLCHKYMRYDYYQVLIFPPLPLNQMDSLVQKYILKLMIQKLIAINIHNFTKQQKVFIVVFKHQINVLFTGLNAYWSTRMSFVFWKFVINSFMEVISLNNPSW